MKPDVKLVKTSENAISPVIGIGLVIVVIAILVGVGFMAMSNVMTEIQTEKDVQMNIQLSGNDIVVTIFSGDDAESLRVVSLFIDTPGDMLNLEKPAAVGTPITFSNVAKGVTGSRFVMVRGKFNDNSDALLKQTKLTFS